MNTLLAKQQNATSIIQSATFVGLRAEHSNIDELHVDKMFNKSGLNIFDLLKEMKSELEKLKETYTNEIKQLNESIQAFQQNLNDINDKPSPEIALSSLTDVVISEPIEEGSVLLWTANTKKWSPSQILEEK